MVFAQWLFVCRHCEGYVTPSKHMTKLVKKRCWTGRAAVGSRSERKESIVSNTVKLVIAV